jgi:thymidylate synthase
MKYPSITEYRNEFAKKLQRNEVFNGTLEIIGASFIANERTIFGTVSEDYLKKEIAWYLSESRSVFDLEDTPEIWKQVSSSTGKINSNYGYLLFNVGNENQYASVLDTLKGNKNTRQAVAIYTRPTMHVDSTYQGMKDFVCTNAVHYEIRDNKLYVVVQMRSNDAVFGYKNDYAWQKYIQTLLVADLIQEYPQLELGDIIWQAASFHIYERHFYLVDHFSWTNELTINKKDYKGKYA